MKKRVELSCIVCGKLFNQLPERIHRYGSPTAGLSCSKECGLVNRRKRQPDENRVTRMYDPHGYVLVFAPNHPTVIGRMERGGNRKNMFVREHRVVMEKHLGRLLEKHETIHHLNGIRDDNRIENLELWVKQQPSGQRQSDLIVENERLRARITELESLLESCPSLMT